MRMLKNVWKNAGLFVSSAVFGLMAGRIYEEFNPPRNPNYGVVEETNDLLYENVNNYLNRQNLETFDIDSISNEELSSIVLVNGEEVRKFNNFRKLNEGSDLKDYFRFFAYSLSPSKEDVLEGN